MKIVIKRLHEDQYGTHGIMVDEDDDTKSILCYTEEQPWRNNAAFVSCITAGKYWVVQHDSEKHPDCWELLNVLNRTKILIHAGNTVKDTEGCILVGMKPMTAGVLESREAIAMLRKIFPPSFQIEIIDVPVIS